MSLPEFWHRLPPETVVSEPAQTLAERGYEVGLVVYNPLAAYRYAYETYRETAGQEATRGGLTLIYVPTEADPNKTIENIANQYARLGLWPDRVFLQAIGGDGVQNTTLHAAQQLGGLAAQQIAAGHKNDLAHLTNSDETLKHPELQLTRPVDLHPTYPLDITITSDAQGEQPATIVCLKAFQSYSDGLSGKVISRAHSPEHRQHPLIPLIGRNILDKLVTFRLSLPDVVQRFHVRRENSWHKTVEFLVANTELMAGELSADADYDTRTARVIEAHDLMCAYLTTAALLARRPVGRLMPEKLERHIYAPNGLYYQVDGEPSLFPFGQVTVTVSKTPKDSPVPKLITPPNGFKHAGSRTKYRPKSPKR